LGRCPKPRQGPSPIPTNGEVQGRCDQNDPFGDQSPRAFGGADAGRGSQRLNLLAHLARGRRYLQSGGRRLSRRPGRSPEPDPAQGHVGGRELPHRGIGRPRDACEDCGHQRIAYNSCLMGKFSNGESACGSLRADLGWPPFLSPLLHVVGRPVIFSVGRDEPSGRCCGTRVSAYPDRIGAHSISVLARSVCWSEQQRLEVIGRRLDSGPEGIPRTYGDQRGTKPSSKPLNWPLLAAQPLPNSPLLNLPIRQLMGISH
jgi:hypothetical protein